MDDCTHALIAQPDQMTQAFNGYCKTTDSDDMTKFINGVILSDSTVIMIVYHISSGVKVNEKKIVAKLCKENGVTIITGVDDIGNFVKLSTNDIDGAVIKERPQI